MYGKRRFLKALEIINVREITHLHTHFIVARVTRKCHYKM